MINNCITCIQGDEYEGKFTVDLLDPPLGSLLFKDSQLMQLSRDIKGPWEARFVGAGAGLYPSYLQKCSCHRLLSYIPQAHVEEALKVLTKMEATVIQCDCPGIVKLTGTERTLTLIWQLMGNQCQHLKQRKCLIQPLYFGTEEACLRLVYRGDRAGQFYSAIAVKV